MADKGLGSAEAGLRVQRFGPNLFRDRPEQSPLVEFLRTFLNPLVLIPATQIVPGDVVLLSAGSLVLPTIVCWKSRCSRS